MRPKALTKMPPKSVRWDEASGVASVPLGIINSVRRTLANFYKIHTVAYEQNLGIYFAALIHDVHMIINANFVVVLIY